MHQNRAGRRNTKADFPVRDSLNMIEIGAVIYERSHRAMEWPLGFPSDSFLKPATR
jgi:hypothetical protein